MMVRLVDEIWCLFGCGMEVIFVVAKASGQCEASVVGQGQEMWWNWGRVEGGDLIKELCHVAIAQSFEKVLLPEGLELGLGLVRLDHPLL